MLRSKMKVKAWVPEFRGCSSVDATACSYESLLGGCRATPGGIAPTSLRKHPQGDDEARPPSLFLSLEAGSTDLPEPRMVLLQEKALGLHLVNIIPGGRLSRFPPSDSFSFLPRTSSLHQPGSKDIRTNPQEHANWQTTQALHCPEGIIGLLGTARGREKMNTLATAPGTYALMYSNMSPLGVCRPSGIQGVWTETVSPNCWSRHPNRILDTRVPYGNCLTLATGSVKVVFSEYYFHGMSIGIFENRVAVKINLRYAQ